MEYTKLSDFYNSQIMKDYIDGKIDAHTAYDLSKPYLPKEIPVEFKNIKTEEPLLKLIFNLE